MENEEMTIAEGFGDNNKAMMALYAAFARAQLKFGSISKDTTVNVKNKDQNKSSYSFKYATLADILEAVRKPLAEEGLSLLQPLEPAQGGGMWLKTLLVHAEGGIMESRVFVATGHNDIKQLGALITYLRRYTLTSMLCLASEEDEDIEKQPMTSEDVPYNTTEQLRQPKAKNVAPEQKPTGGKIVSESQLRILRKQLDEAQKNEVDLIANFGVAAMEDLKFEQFAEVTAWIRG